HDGGTLVPQRDQRGTDRQRAGAIGVGDPYSQPFAADADARMHADRVIVEAGEALCRRRRRRPGPNPFIAAAHGLLPSRLSRDGAAATVGPATVFVANTAGAVPAARAPPTAPGPRPQPWASAGAAQTRSAVSPHPPTAWRATAASPSRPYGRTRRARPFRWSHQSGNPEIRHRATARDGRRHAASSAGRTPVAASERFRCRDRWSARSRSARTRHPLAPICRLAPPPGPRRAPLPVSETPTAARTAAASRLPGRCRSPARRDIPANGAQDPAPPQAKRGHIPGTSPATSG